MLQKKQKLLVAGGDLRQITAARRLAQYHTVQVMGFDAAAELPVLSHGAPHGALDALILPMPVTRDGVFLHTPMYSGSAVSLTRVDGICSKPTRGASFKISPA